MDAATGAPPGTGASEQAEEIIFQNASVRVALKGGRLTSLKDAVRSLEHVSGAADSLPGLFNVRLLKNASPAGKVDATEMSCRVVSRTNTELELAFEHTLATARVRLGQGQSPGETHWSISVQPKDPALTIGQVAFPVFATPLTAGAENKTYLSPVLEGRLLPLRGTQSNWPRYPADAFAQLMARLSPERGFLLWTDDGQGEVKAIGFDRRKQTAAFGVRHFMTYKRGETWKSPYRVRLSFCGAAWQDAADIYRAWATAQPWCNIALRDRRDVPELLLHPPVYFLANRQRES